MSELLCAVQLHHFLKVVKLSVLTSVINQSESDIYKKWYPLL